MTISLGVVMDPIGKIQPKKDSTLGLLLAAQARGWALFYIEPNGLYIENAEAKAYVRRLTVKDDVTHWYTLQEDAYLPLKQLSVVIMRQDPPVDQAYLHTTRILQLAYEQGLSVINRPKSLSEYNEKLLALSFPDCCPPALVTQSVRQAHHFIKHYQDVVIKPLDGMGGESIFRIKHNDPNQHVILETLAKRQEQYFMLQRYIPAIKKGDKRVIMINGEPMAYGLTRIPKPHETRANLAAGGTGVATALTARELEIAARVGPTLKARGIQWAGLDIIGDYLTEINITSPTCVREIERQTDIKINDKLLDCILETIV